SREGVMPFVEPSFDDHVPWVVPLNLGEDISGVEEYARAQQLLPTAGMVADRRLLVVKSGPALHALDVDTFEVVWQRDPGSTQEDSAIVEEPDQVVINWQQRGMHSERADQFENRAVVRRLLRD